MNKNDLIDSLAEEFELTKSHTRDPVDTIFQRPARALITACAHSQLLPRELESTFALKRKSGNELTT